MEKILFPNPASSASVKVIRKDGSEVWAKWGRRKPDEQPTSLPQGGWARAETIEKWKRYNPEKVYIPAYEFYEKGFSTPCKGHPIVALLCEADGENVFYVVTVEAPKEYQHIHNRQPMLAKQTLDVCL